MLIQTAVCLYICVNFSRSWFCNGSRSGGFVETTCIVSVKLINHVNIGLTGITNYNRKCSIEV